MQFAPQLRDVLPTVGQDEQHLLSILWHLT